MEISDQGLYSLSVACDFSAEDCVFDLGTGCGRIMAEILERHPCRGVAVEVNPALARMAAERLSRYGERVQVVAQDLRKVDLAKATAVVCFFTSVALEDLKRYLAAALSIGCVLLNYAYPVPGWWTAQPPTDGVYKYVIGEHRTPPRSEQAPPSEKFEKKSNVVLLSTLTTEAAGTWDPAMGWYYPPQKRASTVGPPKPLTSSRASSQSGAGRGLLSPVSSTNASPALSPSRHRPGDNPRPNRRASNDDQGLAKFSSEDASRAADQERAVEMLHQALEGESIRLLRAAISLGEHARIEYRLLDSARKHLLRLEALEMLMKARASRDPQALRMATCKAEASDLPRAVIEQMKHILRELEYARAESTVEENAALGVDGKVARQPGCVSLPAMRRSCSAPNFFLPGVETKQRNTM